MAGRRQHGFTLLEMVVALAIVAIAVSFAVPLASGPGSARILDATASDIAGVLRLARTSAVGSNTDRMVVLDSVRGRIEVAGVARTRTLAPSVRMAVRASAAGPLSERLVVQFYANGGTSGGLVQLESGGRSATIRIDPLTGRVGARIGG